MSAFPERIPRGSEPVSGSGQQRAAVGRVGAASERENAGVKLADASAASAPGDVAYVLDALKLSLDQELQVAQRLRDRARQVFVLAVAFFTVVQTVAFSSFAQKAITDHKLAISAILALGIVAVALLARTAFAVSQADAPSRVGDLPLEDLEKLLNAAYDRDPAVAGELGEIYLGMIEQRRTANDRRVKAVRNAQVWGLTSIAVTTIELIVALALRIP
jgi:hypothetical protein